VYFVDLDLRITYWNRGAERITGYSAEEVISKRCSDNLLMHVDDRGRQLCFVGCPLSATILDKERRVADVYLSHKEGHRVPVNVSVTPVVGPDGVVVGAVEVFSDISARQRTERRVMELEHLAYLDTLTGIGNRRFAEMKVRHAIEEVKRFESRIALLMIDLDEFKLVNDRHGHAAGDALLKSVAGTLQGSIRAGSIAARWGGDEFVLIAGDVRADQLDRFAARTRNLTAASGVNLGGKRVAVTATVGATLVRGDDTVESVVERADELMYELKRDLERQGRPELNGVRAARPGSGVAASRERVPQETPRRRRQARGSAS
jgi:diguanylate cyclase (GGDEF)-like protein/PAS domain S-box-containing protein